VDHAIGMTNGLENMVPAANVGQNQVFREWHTPPPITLQRLVTRFPQSSNNVLADKAGAPGY
jgi:hypothetical protein